MAEIKVTIKPARKRGYFLKASRGNNYFFVHSRYEPVREAKNWAGQISVEDDINHLIFLGGGLGYFPEEMEKKGYSITILELLPEFDPPEDSPAHRQIQAGKFKFLNPDDNPVDFLDQLSAAKLQTALPVIHPGYSQILGDRVEKLKQDCLLLGRNILRKRQTTRQFFWQWFDNFIENFDYLEECYSLKPLQNSQQNVPAVIAGAGPSLHHSLDWMDTHRGKFFLIATDTSLSTLQCGGIEPDITLTIDPQIENAAYLEGIEPAGRLVGGWESRPEFFRWAAGLTRFVTCTSLGLGNEKTVFPFSSWFRNFIPGVISLQSGGSVTTTALDLAQYLGCGPIGLVGVDHGYTGGRAFPAGSALEKKYLSRLNRFQTLPKIHFEQIISKQNENSKRLTSTVGIKDKPMLTNDEYRIQNEWFEEAAATLPVKCYDFREDGLPMKNWQRVSAPGRLFNEASYSSPVRVEGKQKITVEGEKLKTALKNLLEIIENTPAINQKLTGGSGQIPAVLRTSFQPFLHYAGMHGETPEELADEFIASIAPRLKKLIGKLT